MFLTALKDNRVRAAYSMTNYIYSFHRGERPGFMSVSFNTVMHYATNFFYFHTSFVMRFLRGFALVCKHCINPNHQQCPTGAVWLYGSLIKCLAVLLFSTKWSLEVHTFILMPGTGSSNTTLDFQQTQSSHIKRWGGLVKIKNSQKKTS